jgi:hypothetical protein
VARDRLRLRPDWLPCRHGETLGPAARIVGADFNGAAVQQAREVTASLGLSNVEVVEGEEAVAGLNAGLSSALMTYSSPRRGWPSKNRW